MMKKPKNPNRSKVKKSPADRQTSVKSANESSESEGAAVPQRNDGIRETVESIVVAFVLAFLFRAFEAEAFVIPTGSMAPTLYGRHKDVSCVKCGFQFKVAASDEVDTDGFLLENQRIRSTMCPNCRYHMNEWTTADGKTQTFKDLPVFKGDRILVNKFPYEFGDPKRWDVVVFKYPEEPKTNFIKRLVALPNESIMIKRGDLYKKDESGAWQILRKDDPGKQRELQIIVYDNDHPESPLHALGWPRRWSPVERRDSAKAIAGWSETKKGWKFDPETNSYQLKSSQTQDKQYRWIRYRHAVASPEMWEYAEDQAKGGTIPEFENTRPELISDFCGYNAYTGGQEGLLYRDFYWVGDLTVNCEVTIEKLGKTPELLFELNEGSRRFRCRIDVATGKATLAYLPGFNRDEDEEQVLATAVTKLEGTGKYKVRFANVDNRLCVWINKRLVDFGKEAQYQLTELDNPSPQDGDLIPVGVAARNVTVKVAHLIIERDIYYRSERVKDDGDSSKVPGSRTEVEWEDTLRERLSHPQGWYDEYKTTMQPATFELGPDEYLMLGDNSPRSKDSRLWSNTRRARHRYAVKRSALVGKAFFIYWPHGEPFLNGGTGFSVPYFYHKQKRYEHISSGSRIVVEGTDYPDFRVPFYPQIMRMQRIR